jgi:hypothetical protein
VDNIVSLEWVVTVHDVCSKCARAWMTLETRVAARGWSNKKFWWHMWMRGGFNGSVLGGVNMLDLLTGTTTDLIDRLWQSMAARTKSSSSMW